jgi:hypothetical protein
MHEPFRERTPKMKLTVVFEVVDEIADDPATQIRRDGALEMHFAPGAIRAGELLRDGSIELLRTTFAEWRFDALRSFRALRTQVDAGFRRTPACRAVRRETERAECAEKSTR